MLCLAAALTLFRPTGWRDFLWAFAGVAVAFGASSLQLMPASGVGAVAGIASIWQLLRPARGGAANLLAGLLAGLAAGVHVQLGMPAPAAVGLVLALGAWCGWRQRDPAFAPEAMRAPVLLFVGLVAPVLAATPGIRAGWQSAVALNQDLAGGATADMPSWALQVVAAAFVIGILRGLMVRR